MSSCNRALRLREPIDAWVRSQKGEYQNPIEINHWEYMEKIVPILSAFKKTSKYLEADEYPTGSKALKQMWKLHRALVSTRDSGGHDGLQRAVQGFAAHLVRKLNHVMDDPTHVWQWAFLALLDPTGGIGNGVGSILCVCVCVCVFITVCMYFISFSDPYCGCVHRGRCGGHAGVLVAGGQPR